MLPYETVEMEEVDAADAGGELEGSPGSGGGDLMPLSPGGSNGSEDDPIDRDEMTLLMGGWMCINCLVANEDHRELCMVRENPTIPACRVVSCGVGQVEGSARWYVSYQGRHEVLRRMRLEVDGSEMAPHRVWVLMAMVSNRDRCVGSAAVQAQPCVGASR